MLPDLAELKETLELLIAHIDGDDRADEESEEPSLTVTIGWSPEKGTWGYQVGDNSFTGSAYHHQIWQVAYLSKETDPEETAREIIEGLSEQLPTEEMDSPDPDGDSLAWMRRD